MSREQFERWCRSEGLPTTIWGGQYKDDRTFSAWRGWQARGAVPVKLPEIIPIGISLNDFERWEYLGHNSAINLAAEAIRQAGYPVEGDA